MAGFSLIDDGCDRFRFFRDAFSTPGLDMASAYSAQLGRIVALPIISGRHAAVPHFRLFRPHST
jgi:hypothetical protein